MTLSYVTTNFDKYQKAKINLLPFGIDLAHEQIEIEEIQALDGGEIIIKKAKQAFSQIGKPVLVSDDSWSIPALNGFPGVNMKQCNHYLKADDWLRLMSGIQDRRIFLVSFLAFYNGTKIVVKSHQEEACFLNASQGYHPTAPHLQVVAFHSEKQSIAQYISSGIKIKDDLKDFWQDLAREIIAV